MNTNILDPIKLEDMGRVKLMNRTDTKYWFHAGQVNHLLNSIKEDYFILHIDNLSVQSYSSTYFDTSDNIMYSQHHNGKLNRFKVRRRSYLSSGLSFLEVKIKNNKGKTKKKRIGSEFGRMEFTAQELEFLIKHIPFECTDLHPSLRNQFSRITLVNKNFRERCTIDLDLQFQFENKFTSMDNLAIVELKSDGRDSISPVMLSLRDLRIKSSGFSKYCVGRSIIDPDLKRNNFKRKIRSIEKVIHSNNILNNLN